MELAMVMSIRGSTMKSDMRTFVRGGQSVISACRFLSPGWSWSRDFMGKLELVAFQTLAFLKFSSLALFVHAVEKHLKFTQYL